MKISKKRKVQRIGKALAITLPSLFWRFNDIKPGDTVILEGNEKLLKIRKQKKDRR